MAEVASPPREWKVEELLAMPLKELTELYVDLRVGDELRAINKNPDEEARSLLARRIIAIQNLRKQGHG